MNILFKSEEHGGGPSRQEPAGRKEDKANVVLGC